MYSGTRFVYEDAKWKKIEDARSLKNYFDVVYLENDANYVVNIVDFNYTSIKLEVSLDSKSTEIGKDIPISIYNPNIMIAAKTANSSGLLSAYHLSKSKTTNMNDSKTKNTIEFTDKDGFNLGSIIKIGENSTLIILNETNKGNVGDTVVCSGVGGCASIGNCNYGGGNSVIQGYYSGGNLKQSRTFYLWNMSVVPAGATIISAVLGENINTVRGSGLVQVYNTSIYFANGSMWVEGVHNDQLATINEITWNNQPSAGTLQSTHTFGAVTTWVTSNVTNAAISSYAQANQNMSLMLKLSLENTSANYIIPTTKEYQTAIAPQLNVTYTTGQQLSRTASDVLVYSDSTSRNTTLIRSISDAGIFITSTSRNVSLSISVSDFMTFVDITSRNTTLMRSSSDYLTFLDTDIKNTTLLRGASDYLTFLDSAGRNTTLYRIGYDYVTFIDSDGRNLTLIRAIGDSLIFSDSALRNATYFRSQSDFLAFMDTALPNSTLTRLSSDMLVLIDGNIRIAEFSRGTSDYLTFSGAATRIREVPRIAYDYLVFVGNTSRVAEFTRVASDAFHYTESIISVWTMKPVSAMLVILPYIPGSGDVHSLTIDSGLGYGFILMLLGAFVFRRFSEKPSKNNSD
jgi:hypothetical protein